MPCWWPYPFCMPGFKQLRRQYNICARRQERLRKREERNRRRCAKNLRRFKCRRETQLCSLRRATGSCSSLIPQCQGCAPVKYCTSVPQCTVSQECVPVKYCPSSPQCTVSQGCAPVTCCPSIPQCPVSQGCAPVKYCPSIPQCPVSQGCAPVTPKRDCCCCMGEPSCPTRKRRRVKRRTRSLSEIAFESLFQENCECTPRPEQKRRRARRRPRTRNLCCRCIICWGVVGAIAFFAGYWIPIFAAVVPPP